MIEFFCKRTLTLDMTPLWRYACAFFCLVLIAFPRAADSQGADDLKTREAAVDESGRLRYEYKLGVDDEITVTVSEEDEFTGKPMRINSDGFIKLPLIGRVDAAGRSVYQLEDDITKKLDPYIQKPIVSVNITEYRSQPVTVLGEVNKPGVVNLNGTKTLADVIAMAGGLKEDAGYSLTLTRETKWGTIPLDNAVTDPSHLVNTAKVPLNLITDGTHPEDNLMIRPHDVISVPRGQMVYVMGEVEKAGGFILHDQESISVLQAVSLAGGYKNNAWPSHARILRASEGQANRTEVAVNINAISNGKAEDMHLTPNDILVIPNNTKRMIETRIIETSIALGTGILIWRR
jgi:polysaccharide export outer membrane protein